VHPLTESARFESSHRAVSAREFVAISLIIASILIGVVLRWFHLGALSLWWDEGITALGSSYSPAKIVRFAQRNDTPPLYFLLLHYWEALFGNSEYALRALSALFGTLSLPVFYFLAKKLLKDSMAMALATWLFAFSIMQVWFSREARTYELASFFALLGLYAAISFLERRSLGLFAVMVLSAATSIYLHNMMFFYLLALNVTFLVYPSSRTWTQRLKELFLVDALAGVLFLPWLPSLLDQVNVDVVSQLCEDRLGHHANHCHDPFPVPRKINNPRMRDHGFVHPPTSLLRGYV
jgi:mannosyltransferase